MRNFAAGESVAASPGSVLPASGFGRWPEELLEGAFDENVEGGGKPAFLIWEVTEREGNSLDSSNPEEGLAPVAALDWDAATFEMNWFIVDEKELLFVR
jgi:hypothetical protein